MTLLLFLFTLFSLLTLSNDWIVFFNCFTAHAAAVAVTIFIVGRLRWHFSPWLVTLSSFLQLRKSKKHFSFSLFLQYNHII